MKINLENGLCSERWSCKNINKPCCHPFPRYLKEKLGQYIDCDHYDEE